MEKSAWAVGVHGTRKKPARAAILIIFHLLPALSGVPDGWMEKPSRNGGNGATGGVVGWVSWGAGGAIGPTRKEGLQANQDNIR